MSYVKTRIWHSWNYKEPIVKEEDSVKSPLYYKWYLYGDMGIPNSAGCYAIYSQGKLIYVGESSFLYSRIKNHEILKILLRLGLDYKIKCKLIPDDKVRRRTAKNLIKRLTPQINIKDK